MCITDQPPFERFFSALALYGVDAAPAKNVFCLITAAYSENHRHYHTLDHIGFMFAFIDRFSTERNSVVELAVWFHDAVYDPKQQENEEKSVELMVSWLDPLGVPKEILERVGDLILATKTHKLELGVAHQGCGMFLDADLAVLGASCQQYKAYVFGIRKEYSYLSDRDFCVGRMRFLREYLTRKTIFYTADIIKAFEIRARKNMRLELGKLEQYL